MKTKSFECDLCQEIFTRKDNLKKHYIRKHEKIYRDGKTLNGQMTCNCQDCTLEFFHKKKFIEHLAAAHKINIESKRLSFPAVEQLISWKEKEEVKNYVYFSKPYKNSTSNNFKNIYFVCQHDGKDRVHRKKDEPARKTDKIHKHGKVKAGLFCLTRIFVKEDLSKKKNCQF